MPVDAIRRRAEELLAPADVRVDGDRPWDVQVHDPRLWVRVFAEGSLGLGESYMDGWWDCEQLDAFFHRVLAARARHPDRALEGRAARRCARSCSTSRSRPARSTSAATTTTSATTSSPPCWTGA